MTNDELIAAARARLAEHGANSAVMKELAAVLAAYDYERSRDLIPRPFPGDERRQGIQDAVAACAELVEQRAKLWRQTGGREFWRSDMISELNTLAGWIRRVGQ